MGAAIPCYLAWRLSVAAYDIDFPDAVSDALYQAAWLFCPLDFIRRSCRHEGLAQAHFGWSAGLLRTVGGEVRWLLAVGVPLVFVIQVLHSSDADTLRNALERLLFAEGMVVVSVFLYRVLRPSCGLLRELVAEERNEWADRVQRFCRWGGIAGSLLLAGLVIAGYDYTARQFMWRTSQTAVALLAACYLRALLLRWILIHRRLMGMQQVTDRRMNEIRSTIAADADVAAAAHADPIPKLDLATLSAQTRTLVNVAILTSLFVTTWWIWSDMFPSVAMLNHWEVWTTSVGDRVEPVTLGNLLSAALIAVMTWIAVRNLPGLLEMTVLQRLPLDTAGRFAVSTLGRYAIVVIGLVLTSGAIGIGWSKVQWLATALTFGLAFGLQEIFANFIAGLIILFERPVRVGDMVTIDSVTGVVSRIRIRATTITNSDRKEFIVPNKEFITGRLLNWTLTDTVNRIVISVGIAYGSDTDLAQELLLKVASDNSAVLRDPVPTAGFEEFGEGGLKLVLRCFLPNLSERTRVVHELHAAIIRSLTAHGIEIAGNAKEGAKPAVPLVVQRAPAPHLGRTG
jgi:potassium-dependent mechanosensitive channel